MSYQMTHKYLGEDTTATQDKAMCPLCPEWGECYPIGDDFFGEACEIDGVACCETCYIVHWINRRGEEA